MSENILTKIRKLNWVLSKSTTGELSYTDLSNILMELGSANAYILDIDGKVLGVSYNRKSDTSTFEDESGVEKIPASDNKKFLEITETRSNIIGDELTPILGSNYKMKDKYHVIVPCVCGGQRLGTILLTRYDEKFNDEDVAILEYGATVVGLEIQRNLQLKKAKERSLRMACDMAFDTLSFSEKDAVKRILSVIDDEEGIIVASKIAQQYNLTNSVIVNACRKLESARLIETKSLGMKGTYIKIVNPYLKESYATI